MDLKVSVPNTVYIQLWLYLFRCQNGYEWNNGKWPYMEMECLNKRWVPENLPSCKSRNKLT